MKESITSFLYFGAAVASFAFLVNLAIKENSDTSPASETPKIENEGSRLTAMTSKRPAIKTTPAVTSELPAMVPDHSVDLDLSSALQAFSAAVEERGHELSASQMRDVGRLMTNLELQADLEAGHVSEN